jgi:Spo0E like sporulation regulatory protein.
VKELEKLLKDIEILREEMELEIDGGNLLTDEVLIRSQKLDQVLNKYSMILKNKNTWTAD